MQKKADCEEVMRETAIHVITVAVDAAEGNYVDAVRQIAEALK